MSYELQFLCLPKFATGPVEGGKLKQPDALPILPQVRRRRETIKASMPRVRIKDLLQDVDKWCGFIRAFSPRDGYEPRHGDTYRLLLPNRSRHESQSCRHEPQRRQLTGE